MDCDLCKTRTNVVLYRGESPCDLLFIGEAPGNNEDLSGIPFIGSSGELLDSWLNDLFAEGFEFTYGVTNIVACFPFNINPQTGRREPRPPKKEEADACKFRLHTTIEQSSPLGICLLGKSAKKFIRLPKQLLPHEVTIFEVMHPAGILRRGGKHSLEYKRNYFELRDNLVKILGEKAIKAAVET